MGRIAVNAIVLLIAAATTPLSAAIITFDNLNIFGSQVVIEDGMRYQTSDAFGVRNFTGNPPSGLIGTPIAPGMFIVTRNGGGNFTFDRYDFASFGPPNHSDTWEFLGLLEGVQQFSFIDFTSGGFSTRITDLSNSIDQLEISVVAGSTAAAVADNLVFTLGSATGDPHFTTYSGAHYNYQGLGDFLLTRSTVPGDQFDVQVRTRPWRGGAATIMSEAAATLCNQNVNFDIDRASGGGSFVSIDGQSSSLSVASPVLNLGTCKIDELSPEHYQLVWNTGEILDVTDNGTYLDLSSQLSWIDGLARWKDCSAATLIPISGA